MCQYAVDDRRQAGGPSVSSVFGVSQQTPSLAGMTSEQQFPPATVGGGHCSDEMDQISQQLYERIRSGRLTRERFMEMLSLFYKPDSGADVRDKHSKSTDGSDQGDYCLPVFAKCCLQRKALY